MRFGYILFWGMLVETVFMFFLAKQARPATDVWLWLAQGSGVFGLFTLSWTYILAIRHPWIERLFGGLDKQYTLHHALGAISFLLLFHHPIFLIIRQLPSNMLWTYLVPAGIFSYTLGMIALYTLLLLIVLTLFVDMPYKVWKQTHEWMGIVIIFGAWHGLLVSSDMSKFSPLTVWMSGWSIVALLAYVYKRFLYYWLFSAKRYSIVNLVWEKDLIVLTLRANSESDVILFVPGQFGFLAFDHPKSIRNEHPFSVIACEGDIVRFGIKVTGGFTLQLAQSPIGTSIAVRGPYGSFGQNVQLAPQMLWIAGGIGITPFISLLSKIQSHQQLTFILSVRGEGPRLLIQMVQRMITSLPQVSFVVHDTERDGRLTAKRICSYIPIAKGARVLICGPQSMMHALTDQLHEHGIRRKHISFEDFSFR